MSGKTNPLSSWILKEYVTINVDFVLVRYDFDMIDIDMIDMIFQCVSVLIR